MSVVWWHWVAMGMVLVGLELIVPSFTIIWFGLGAILVGAITALLPGIPLSGQILLWTVTSIMFTIIWFRYFRQRGPTTSSGQSKESFVGEIGLIIKPVGPYETGRIRFVIPVMGSDEWNVSADIDLKIGDRAKIVDIAGHTMKVTKP